MFIILILCILRQIRVRLLMELARTSGRNILLVGPEGAGKSCLVNDFLDKQGTFYDELLYTGVVRERLVILLVYLFCSH